MVQPCFGDQYHLLPVHVLDNLPLMRSVRKFNQGANIEE